MNKSRSRFVPGLGFDREGLERRLVLSAVAAAEVARAVATKTTLAVEAGTLGQPVTFTATVRAPASAGSPTGSVAIIDRGQMLGTMTLAPVSSTGGHYAYSEATGVLDQPAGGTAYFFGRHQVSAKFLPSGSFGESAAATTFTVPQPDYTELAGGVKVATIAPGSGPQIQSGQTASVLYTGFLERTGQIFDDSTKDGGSPFSFKLGADQVIPGFDAGTTGMQAGETRVILIPPAEGYGSKHDGPIPANSTLIFVVTLESIS